MKTPATTTIPSEVTPINSHCLRKRPRLRQMPVLDRHESKTKREKSPRDKVKVLISSFIFT